ncbi:MAG: amidohydrolase, partial [Phycisphaeraceae bacterium]
MGEARWRDAHLHLAAHGEELDSVSLRACGSVGECLEILARAAADAPEDAWITARHARVESWTERRWPTARELDEATGGRRAFVQSFDHHALAASTRAMERTGVLEYAGDGVIERDGSGRATGLLLEGAANA